MAPKQVDGYKNRGFFRRLGYAFEGVAYALRNENSFRVQLVGLTFAVGSLLVLRPPLLWCVAVLICAAGVLSLELLNTALETWIDHAHPGQAEPIRRAKDAAAAAVLIWALLSLAVFGALLYSLH